MVLAIYVTFMVCRGVMMVCLVTIMQVMVFLRCAMIVRNSFVAIAVMMLVGDVICGGCFIAMNVVVFFCFIAMVCFIAMAVEMFLCRVVMVCFIVMRVMVLFSCVVVI